MNTMIDVDDFLFISNILEFQVFVDHLAWYILHYISYVDMLVVSIWKKIFLLSDTTSHSQTNTLDPPPPL